jgi:O-antigen/teichoic acid export membrane protein
MRKSLLKAASLNLMAQVANGVGAIVTTAIVSRTLGPVQTGHYALAAFAIITIGALVTQGGPLVVTRSLAESSGDVGGAYRSRISGLSVRWGTCGAAVAIIFSVVAIATGLASQFSLGAKVAIGIGLVAYVPFAYGSALLSGEQRFRLILQISASCTLLQVAGTVAVAVVHPEIGSFLAVVSAGFVCQGLLFWRYAPRPSRHLTLAKDQRGQFRRDAIVISGIFVLDTIVLQRTEVFFLAALSTARQVAFFSLASSLVTRAMAFLPGAIASVLLPRFAASNDVSAEYSMSMRMTMLASVPLAGWFVACAPLIVEILYGHAFHAMSNVVLVISVAAIGTAVGSVGGSAAYATRSHGKILVIQGACAVLNIVLALVLCGPLGALGGAIAGSSAQIVGVITGFWMLEHYLGIHSPWSAMGRVVLAGLVAASVGLAVRMACNGINAVVGLLIVTVSFGLAFAAAIAASGALEEDESAALATLIRNVVPLSPRRARTSHAEAR